MSKKLIANLEQKIEYSRGYRAGLLSSGTQKQREKQEQEVYKREMEYYKKLDTLAAKLKENI